MLLHMYQIFSSLLGHLHFFVHFSFTFVGQFFLGHPIYKRLVQMWWDNYCFAVSCYKSHYKCYSSRFSIVQPIYLPTQLYNYTIMYEWFTVNDFCRTCVSLCKSSMCQWPFLTSRLLINHTPNIILYQIQSYLITIYSFIYFKASSRKTGWCDKKYSTLVLTA